jgi:hypothetical protein
MNDDTIIPLTINGRRYDTRAADCLGELVSWGYNRFGSITPSVSLSYGMPEEYIHGFAEYARDCFLRTA